MNSPLFDTLMQRQAGTPPPGQQGGPPLNQQAPPPSKPPIPPQLGQGIFSQPMQPQGMMGQAPNTSGQPGPGGQPPPPSPNMTNTSTPPPIPNLPAPSPLLQQLLANRK